MKINIWLLLGLFFPSSVSFSQSILSTGTNIDSNHQNLLAFEQDTSKGPEDFVPYDEAPQAIKIIQPKYPESALKDSIEGNVFVKVWITEQGDVKKAEIVRSTYEGFNNAAIEASKQWKFTPAIQKGKPIAIWIIIPFRFKIFCEKVPPKESNAQIETSHSILQAVDQILKGYDLKKMEGFINPEAYLIFGKYYESLHGVLNGEHKEIKLIEGPESNVVLSHFTMSDDKTTAYAILKTQIKKGGPMRFHTIVFMKTKNSDWQIKHWQVSF